MTVASWITTASTAVIACFTFALWWATKKQSELTRASIDLAKQEFISTHRPRLIVQNVKLVLGVQEGQPVLIDWLCVNIGDSKATITSVQSKIFIMKIDEKLSTNLSLVENQVDKDTIDSGERLIVRSNEDISVDKDLIYQLTFAGFRLCIVGCVQYMDRNGVKRQTGFARYCPERKHGHDDVRFEAIDDQEYEYEY